MVFLTFQSLLSLMDVEGTTKRLMSILSEAAHPKDPSHLKTGLWGRAQVCAFIFCQLTRYHLIV